MIPDKRVPVAVRFHAHITAAPRTRLHCFTHGSPPGLSARMASVVLMQQPAVLLRALQSAARCIPLPVALRRCQWRAERVVYGACWKPHEPFAELRANPGALATVRMDGQFRPMHPMFQVIGCEPLVSQLLA